MEKHTELITLYCAVYAHYDSTLVTQAQRQSNNFCPKFTDVECIEAAVVIEKLTGIKRSIPQVRNFLKKTDTAH